MAQQIFDIDDSYFTSNAAMGGNDGSNFYCGVKKGQPPQSGTIVRSLKGWYDSNTMRGLEVELTDGSNHAFGSCANVESTEKFYLAEGEKVISLKIWYDKYRNGRCGGFEMTTNEKNIDNQNRIFSVPAPRKGDPYEPELGSGILIGVFGNCGKDIDSLGFALLRRVESAQLLEVNYPNISTLLVPTAPKSIKTITYDNSGEQRLKHILSLELKVSKHQSHGL